MTSQLTLHGIRTPVGGPYSLVIPSSPIMFLEGKSGVGKSLLLRSIADLDPHEGHAELKIGGGRSFDSGVSILGTGDDEYHLDSRYTPPQTWRKTIGLLLADSGWWKSTVAEHFCGSEVDQDQIKVWASDIFLDWRTFKQDLEELSTGELNRWGLLRLLSRRPRALLLDEPTANLDSSTARQVESLVGGYIQSSGASTIWVSHDRNQVERLGGVSVRMGVAGLQLNS